MTTVFVYGTLTEPDTAVAVLPAFEFVGSATLEGLHRVEGHYPTLAPGGAVSGRLLRTEHVDALDRYEGVQQGLYARVSVPTDGGEDLATAGEEPSEETVETYVGDPDRLGTDVCWPGEESFPACVREYVRERDVYATWEGEP